MENSQIALKLVLDAMGEPNDISDVNERLRLQKAVYIAQAVGIPFGYNYSWYVKGPYSPELTQDYYALSAALGAADTSAAGKVLNPTLATTASKAKEILALPRGKSKKFTPQWYEALASLHFLVMVSKKSVSDAREFVLLVKPHLADLVDLAVERLKQHFHPIFA